MRYRTHTCGELRISDLGREVILSGWIQRIRNLGGMTFIDLRDRYGITQLVFDEKNINKELKHKLLKLGREYIIRVQGKVIERSNKNPKLSTGDIEIRVEALDILSQSETPPFTIEDETDGGEELRAKYRYLDLRRRIVKKGIELRHQMAQQIRYYLNKQGFLEIETPFLIKSTPEGARDFVVPSRLNPGKFYALPQSPQTFKQLLMIAGFDKYYQIVKCFRDEDFRADRQPEFTQLDCEMSFVDENDVINTFEGLAKHLFKTIKNIEFNNSFPRIKYSEALKYYGTDSPDIRFDMKIADITTIIKGKGFNLIDNADYVACIAVENCANYSRKQLNELTNFVKQPPANARGLTYIKYNSDSKIKSSIDKFYSASDLQKIIKYLKIRPGTLILIIAGPQKDTLKALGILRLEMAQRLKLLKPTVFAPVWIIDFPLLEWDEDEQRYQAMHHPFTSPKDEDINLLETSPEKVRAKAYDFVINGIEIGGGSIRIHSYELQQRMFHCLGLSQKEALEKFGFLMNAFRYGAPPHGGIAFGFDRWVALFDGSQSIRNYIPFPKNNAGQDIMINTPSQISKQQLDELGIQLKTIKI